MSEQSNSNILEFGVSIYDECERHENCVVEVWKNSVTGEVSVGWWENEDDDSGN